MDELTLWLSGQAGVQCAKLQRQSAETTRQLEFDLKIKPLSKNEYLKNVEDAIAEHSRRQIQPARNRKKENED
jgi:hypothetical protein